MAHYLQMIWDREIKNSNKDVYLNFYKECATALQEATAEKGYTKIFTVPSSKDSLFFSYMTVPSWLHLPDTRCCKAPYDGLLLCILVL